VKRRIRKKNHVGDYRQLGFYVYVYPRPDIGGSIFDSFRNALLDDIGMHLNAPPFGAFWGHSYFELFVCPLRGSATDEHKAWLRARLSNDVNVASFEFGPLIDAWWDESLTTTKRIPHPEGLWSELVFPGDRKWWKRGQPPGWRVNILWTMRHMYLKLRMQRDLEQSIHIVE
jgi:uncharacterized protein YggL (DUF469 family)